MARLIPNHLTPDQQRYHDERAAREQQEYEAWRAEKLKENQGRIAEQKRLGTWIGTPTPSW